MKLRLVREVFTDKSTIGRLFVDGTEVCVTLEDVVRDKKIAGETCIPYGSYEVRITYSPKFEQDMPLLMNVPGFTGIRIHPGNNDQHTHGCILVGTGREIDRITGSKDAYAKVFRMLKGQQNVSIEIVEPDGD